MIINKLKSSSEKLLSLVAPISDQDFTKKPTEYSWSIAEIVYHLSLVDQGNIERIETSKKHPAANVLFIKKIIPFEIILRFRGKKVKAPVFVEPTGAIGLTKAEIINRYKESRTKLIQYIEANINQLPTLTPKHPIFGFVTGSVALRILLGHEARHMAQIKEIQRALP